MSGRYRNPVPTVDLIIRDDHGRVVLIRRRNPPHGWALPGGFVEYGESLENAARREAREETSLEVVLDGQFHTYSRPDRDPRLHTITTVFLASISRGGELRAADDAAEAGFFSREHIAETRLAFDHAEILRDYFDGRFPVIKTLSHANKENRPGCEAEDKYQRGEQGQNRTQEAGSRGIVEGRGMAVAKQEDNQNPH